jgi:hypothetical protein
MYIDPLIFPAFRQVRSRERFSYSRDAVDTGSSSTLLPPSIQTLLAEDTGFQGDEEEDNEDFSDEDSDSFNSTRTDLTYLPSREAADLSDEFCTARNSREHSRSMTPTNQVLWVQI